MVRKWPKSGRKWPKLPQNWPNKSQGSPRKSQRIPKYRKNGKKRSHSAIWKCTKTVKMAKNYAKIMQESIFFVQQLPKKGHFLKEMHPFFFPPSAKKSPNFFSRLRRCTVGPPLGGGCYIISVFCASVFCALYLSLQSHFNKTKSLRSI